jgi:hypothetical protein
MMKFNLTGRLRDFFFRVPEVRGIASSEGTQFITARVPPLVLPGGVPVNLLPVDSNEFQSLFKDNTLNDPMTSFVVAGEGASAFSDPVHVELYEAPGITLKYLPSKTPELSKLSPMGPLDAARIEDMNGAGVIAISEREVVPVEDTSGYLRVRGWAVNVGAVYVQLDGKLYPANYGRQREDIHILYRTPESLESGYDWTFPSWKLGKSVHEITLKMLTADHKGYYDFPKKIRFRMVP